MLIDPNSRWRISRHSFVSYHSPKDRKGFRLCCKIYQPQVIGILSSPLRGKRYPWGLGANQFIVGRWSGARRRSYRRRKQRWAMWWASLSNYVRSWLPHAIALAWGWPNDVVALICSLVLRLLPWTASTSAPTLPWQWQSPTMAQVISGG
jgi:hypothetical protein